MSVECSVRRIRVGGCPVDSFSFAEAVSELCRRIENRVRAHVVFVNTFKVAQFRSSRVLRESIERADMLLADGVPIVWASRLLRTPLPERVNGSDLMEAMVAVAAERGYRVYFLGGQPHVITRVVSELRLRHPQLQVAGYRDGFFRDDEQEALIEEINASDADLLFLGISTPRKELWGDRNLSRLKLSVCQGAGGTFDVIAGVTRRAPSWMQRCGLEWFFRLVQEPRRMWRRYLNSGAIFAWLVSRDLLRMGVRLLK